MKKVRLRKSIQFVIFFVPFFFAYVLIALVNKAMPVYPICSIFLLSLITSTLKPSFILIISYFIFIVLIGFFFMPNWLMYYEYPNPYKKETIIIPDLIEGNKAFNTKSLTNKIVVMDFWSTTCVNCFKKFPELESFSKKYKTDSTVKIFSVGLPTSIENIEELKLEQSKLKYNFKKIYTSDTSCWDKLKIDGVPEVLILDKKGQVRYRGPLAIKWFNIYNINKLITALKNED